MRRGRLGVAAALACTLAAQPGPARAAAAPDTRDLTTLVNTQNGSFGAGFTFTGAQVPFGMTQLGPDTNYPNAFDPLNYTGYTYQNGEIHGFSLSHFSGAGIKIGAELPFMPETGAVVTAPLSYAQPFQHATEVAQPGSYSVDLANGIKVELAATQRAGIQRYTFPSTTSARVLLNGSLSQTAPTASSDPTSTNAAHLTDLHVVGDHTLVGSTVEPKSGGYTEWFAAEFDRPFSGFGTFAGSTVTDGTRDTRGTANGAYLTFDTTAVPTVSMRVAISYVDAAGAVANLHAEAPAGTTLDQVRAAAHDAWNARLHDIEVTGGQATDQQTFYSMLYRALGMPNLFDDADGRYLGFDGVVRTVRPGEHHYTNLSIWDTYKTQAPLLALIEPSVEHDVVMSLLDDYEQSGQIPKWVDANLEYGIEGGDSGFATVADGAARGLLHGAEVTRAYAALRDQATTLAARGPAREHNDEFTTRGWIGFSGSSGRPVAETVEYSTDDAAVVGIASRVGSAGDAAFFADRGGHWRNVLYPGTSASDPDADFIRPRHADGTWADPDSEQGVTVPWNPVDVAGYQEASGWQTTLGNIGQDMAGYAGTLGVAATQSRLDTFFSTALADAPYGAPNANGENLAYYGASYAPGNETDLPAPWFYDVLDQPWKTSKVVRQVRNVFDATVDAFPGNDDAGSMASWWVQAALGLYGGVAQGTATYAVNSPLFPLAVVHLGSVGSSFTINAPAASPTAYYIAGLRRDGAALSRSYLTQCDLTAGRVIDEDLVATEDHTWATQADSGPPSLSDPSPRAPVETCLDRTVSAAAVTPPASLPEVPLPAVLIVVALPLVVLARRRSRRSL